MADLSPQFAKTGIAKLLNLNTLGILFSLAGFLLVVISTSPHGIGLTPDSVAYVSAARSLSAGNGLTLFDSSPLTLFPPVYPVALSLAEFVSRLDPVEGARYANALFFGLIIYLSGIFFRRHLGSPAFVTVGLASVTLSPVLFERASFALAEPLFILWSLLFMLVLENYLERRSVKLLLLLGFLAALASLTRYIGVSFAATGIAAILFLLKSPLRSKLTHFILFGTVSVLPLCAWVGRNYILSGMLTGSRDSSSTSIAHSLGRAMVYFSSWFFPVEFLADRLESVFTLLLIAAVSGYLIGVLWSPRSIVNGAKTAFGQVGPLMLFVGVYTTVLVAITFLIYIDDISDRFLSPVFVPTVLIILFLLKQYTHGKEGFFSYRLFGFAGSLSKSNLIKSLLVAWLMFPSYQVALISSQLMNTGLDYSHVDWRESDTLNFVREHLLPLADDTLVYSNHPDVIYIYTGASVSFAPRAQGDNLSKLRRPVTSITGSWPGSPSALLVWFDNTHRHYLFKVDELNQIADIAVVARLADGAVYHVSTK